VSTQGKAVAGVLFTALLAVTILYFQHRTISTNIAYTQRTSVTLSSQHAGRVKALHYQEGDTVEALSAVAVLDDTAWQTERVLLDEEINNLATHEQRVATLLSARQHELEQIKQYINTLQNDASQTKTRLNTLLKSGIAGSEKDKDEVRWALHTQNANLSGMQRERDTVEIKIIELSQEKEALKQRRLSIARRDALLNEKRAQYTVSSLSKGRISNIYAYPGDSVVAGQPVISLVSLDDQVYITAYFDERHYEQITPGTKVSITLDAMPDKPFGGMVSSISPLAGASVSGNYPNYSSGSFTRIGQKVPVRIDFDHAPYDLPAGMSATIKISKDE